MSRIISALMKELGSVTYLESKLLKFSSFQLRKDYEGLGGLVSSIQTNGLLQPVIVRPKQNYFEVVAGNRRLAACHRLRISKILVVVKELTDKEAFEVALTENLQRRTLNPIEEARGFKKYVEDYGYGGISELARQIGKSEEYVSHRTLLLTLPLQIQEKISSQLLTPSAAEELLWVNDPSKQLELSNIAEKKKLSSKLLRKIARSFKSNNREASLKMSPSDSFPDFELNQHDISKQEISKMNGDMIISETILILKSTLVQFDNVIEQATLHPNLKSELLAHRYVIHQLVDKMLITKKARKWES